MKSRAFIAGAALLALLGVTACSDDEGSPTDPGPGTTPELNSGNIPNGQSWVHTFSSAGAFGYHCSIHNAMTGTVNATAGSGADSVVVTIANSTASGFQPGTTTVKVGGYVRWVNSSGVTHTVTSH